MLRVTLILKSTTIVLLLLTTILSSSLALASSYDQGVSHYGARNYTQAAQCFERVIKESPKNANAYYYLGLCHQNLGENAKAIGYYRLVSEHFAGCQAASFANKALETCSAGYTARMQTTDAKDKTAPSSPRGAPSAHETGVDKAANDVKIPFTRYHGGHLLVDAHLNGLPLRMIFDTGAESILIGKNHFRALGLVPPSGPPIGHVQGVGGLVEVWETPAEIQLGGMKRYVKVIVQDALNLPPLLGQTFFRDYAYDIDTQGGFIHFTRKEKGLREKAYVPQDTINIPFVPEGRELVVTATVNGKLYPMFFDTGASQIVLSIADAAELGIHIPNDAPMVQTSGVGGSAYGYLVNIDRMELGPVLKTNIQAAVLIRALPRPLLGQSFFGNKRFTIDNENRLIRFWR